MSLKALATLNTMTLTQLSLKKLRQETLLPLNISFVVMNVLSVTIFLITEKSPGPIEHV